MKTKFQFLFLLAGLSTPFSMPSVAIAQDPTLSTSQYVDYYKEVARYFLQKVNRAAPAQGAPQCSENYSHILAKGSMDIVYSLGYLDSAGLVGPTVDANGIDYGMARSMDQQMFKAIGDRLTEKCRYPDEKLCEFSETESSPGLAKFHKEIQFHGQPLKVNLTLTHSSASEVYEKNTATLKSLQTQLTTQAERIFAEGLRNADIVFYNGHSRNGGGPDFAPPVLLKNKHTNYAHYLKSRAGIKRITDNIKLRKDSDLILGLFSCSSNRHFSKRIQGAKPQQKMILSGDTVYFNETLEGSLGYLESILRGTCGSELSEAARQSDRTKYGFSDYNM